MRMLPSRRPSPSVAVCGRALTRFSSFVLILMVVSMPFGHSSRTSFPGGRSVAEQRAIVTLDVGRNLLKGSVGNGGAVLNVEEREVPRGPESSSP